MFLVWLGELFKMTDDDIKLEVVLGVSQVLQPKCFEDLA